MQFPRRFAPAGMRCAAGRSLGHSTRQAKLGYYPPSMLIGQGRSTSASRSSPAASFSRPTLFPIEVQEIVRCTTLAIRRRAMLMGPLAAHDPLFNELVAALSRPRRAAQPLVGGVDRPGIGRWPWRPAGREAQAVAYLQRAVVAGGEFDHPLTSMALLELGRLAMIRGDFPGRREILRGSHLCGGQLSGSRRAGRGLPLRGVAHLMANRKGIFPPLAPAIAWAKANHLRQLQASLAVAGGREPRRAGRRPATAATLLDEARATIARRADGSGRIGARLSFLDGLVYFQQKKIADGDKAWPPPWATCSTARYWLFQISLADTMATTGTATARTAMELYQDVLRDPRPADWSADPMESLAVLVTPHPLPLEHWFEVAMARKDHEAAMEIGDRMRRHRFFTSPGLRRPAGVAALGPGRARRDARRTKPAAPAGSPDALPGLRAASPAGPCASRRSWRPCRWWPKTRTCSRKQTPGLAQLATLSQQQEASCGRWPSAASRPGWSSRRCAAPPTSRSRCPRVMPCWSSSPPAARLLRIPPQQRALQAIGNSARRPLLSRQRHQYAARDGQFQAEP